MRARDRFRANVVFVGTATPHRERQLSELVEFGVAVWGPGWRRTKLRDYCRGELLNHEDYIRAYAGASVAVNVAWGQGAEDGAEPGASRRLFELAAIGVPQVVEEHPDIHRHFREGSEILVARRPARAPLADRRGAARPGVGRSGGGRRAAAGTHRAHLHAPPRVAAARVGRAGAGADRGLRVVHPEAPWAQAIPQPLASLLPPQVEWRGGRMRGNSGRRVSGWPRDRPGRFSET